MNIFIRFALHGVGFYSLLLLFVIIALGGNGIIIHSNLFGEQILEMVLTLLFAFGFALLLYDDYKVMKKERARK